MNNWTFDEIEVGYEQSFSTEITGKMEDSFREISGDVHSLHYDDAFAAEVSDGKYQKHFTFGMLTASLYSTMEGCYIPGKYGMLHSIDIKFINPVFVGDILTVQGKVTEKIEGLNLILVKTKIMNQDNQCVSKADMKVLVLK